MDKKFAQIVSLVLEPVVLLVVMVVVLSWGQSVVWGYSGIVYFVVGMFLPILSYATDYFPRIRKFIPGRHERSQLYLLAVFGYVFTSILFGTAIANSSFWFYLSMLTSIYFAVLYLVNTYFDKASFHVSTFCFVLSVLTASVSTGFAIIFAASPLVVWSRLRLGKHTWVEVMWGMVVGLAVGLLAWAI